ncbi:MAG: hypothetical protein JW969_04785 [Spirochaetales bacterium]|nr:hypothetical protein [Spirochaetales bacterium]
MRKQIEDFYNSYRDEAITFNQHVITETGLIREEIWIKCQGKQNNCVLFMASMVQAKLIIKLSPVWFTMLNEADKKITLHLSFNYPSIKGHAGFIIDSKIVEFSKFQGNQNEIYVMTVNYRKQAPDDLIEILGEFLSSRKDVEKRIYERIKINPENSVKIGLLPAETVLFNEGKAKRCILNELSIFSAQVLIGGRLNEFHKKRVMLLIKTEPANELGEMVGDVIACTPVEGGQSLLALVIKFDQELIPPSYKMFIGEFLERLVKR